MPILDVEVVSHSALEPGLARRIADAAAEVLGATPGKLWVKLRRLDPAMYAENASEVPLPVFVSVLKARCAGQQRRRA
jgi:phenylpyruvate tautomerase PptA (4-oxalocrotonate tautomerase family)